MKKVVLIVFIFLFLVQMAVAADQIILNSEDWSDVYSGMLYASLTGTTTSFLVSDRHSTLILNAIPKETTIQAISSNKAPFIVGYKSILESRGYDAEETIYDNFNLELAKLLDVESFIIVDDSYGYNAISVAPYAVVSNSYVVFADKNNIREVDSFLNGKTVGQLIIYGYVDRQVKDVLAKYNPEIINKDGDRFANNIEIVKKYQEIRGAKQVILTNGEFIEKEIMSGSEPVVFIGANNVPDQVKDYIQGTEIEIGILIGNELVGTATYIRRNVGLNVFVKFAQGARSPTGPISQVEALDMFYLPVFTLNMEVDSIKYNRATNQLEVNLRNTEEQAVYFKGTYALKGSDGKEQKVGDIDTIFLDGNELKTVVYDLEPITEGKITADVYIIYGESKGSMEKVLDTTVDVETVEVLDKCEISLNNLVYNKKKGLFYVEIENLAKVDCYVDMELIDIMIDGEPNSFSAEEIISIKSGKKEKQKIKARLEEEDIEDNSVVKVRAYYGERKDSLINILEAEFELVLAGVDYLFYSLLLVIIILILLIIWSRRKKKKK
ncbi:MAG: hypothetical protein V1740_02140 [Candidatus Woesearchaeota archaeon]